MGYYIFSEINLIIAPKVFINCPLWEKQRLVIFAVFRRSRAWLWAPLSPAQPPPLPPPTENFLLAALASGTGHQLFQKQSAFPFPGDIAVELYELWSPLWPTPRSVLGVVFCVFPRRPSCRWGHRESTPPPGGGGDLS